MRQRRIAASVRAALASAALIGAVCAEARAAPAFELVERARPPHTRHLAAYACALAGAGLIGASFPLADEANRRYAAYEAESDPTRITARWDATVRADHVASAALLTGEGLLVTATWLRFVHHPASTRVAIGITPSRCVVACSF